MSRKAKIAALVVTLVAVVCVVIGGLYLKNRSGSGETAKAQKQLPQVIDLGRGECIPCKLMKPILEELAEEYRGKAIIRIIDVGDKPDEAIRYRIRLIPTQVFIDAEGNEVWRHEGYLSKEEIVLKLQEMGVE